MHVVFSMLYCQRPQSAQALRRTAAVVPSIHRNLGGKGLVGGALGFSAGSGRSGGACGMRPGPSRMQLMPFGDLERHSRRRDLTQQRLAVVLAAARCWLKSGSIPAPWVVFGVDIDDKCSVSCVDDLLVQHGAAE